MVCISFAVSLHAIASYLFYRPAKGRPACEGLEACSPAHAVRVGLRQANCPYVGQLRLLALQGKTVLNQGLALREVCVPVRVLKVRQLKSLEVLVRAKAGIAEQLLVLRRLPLEGVVGQLRLELAARQHDGSRCLCSSRKVRHAPGTA